MMPKVLSILSERIVERWLELFSIGFGLTIRTHHIFTEEVKD
jgi:hypothetical protein